MESPTEDGQLANILKRSWQSKYKANDQANDCEDDCASPMICQNVHSDSESQDVRTADEDQDEN